MPVRVTAGDALLGARLEVNCKNLIPSRRAENFHGRTVFSFRVLEGTATIAKKLAEEIDEKTFRSYNISCVEGDAINARNIWGWAETTKLPKRYSVGTSSGRSGAHSRQDWTVEGDVCFAVIITTWNKENINPHPRELGKNHDMKSID